MKNFPELVFIFILLIPGVLPPGVTSAIYAVIILFCLIAAHWKIERNLLSLLFPFTLLFLLGMAGALGHILWDVSRDIWYLSKIVLAFSVGYLLMRYLKSFQNLCRLVVVATILASIHLWVQVALHYHAGVSLMELHELKGVRGSILIAAGLALVIAFPHFFRMSGFRYPLIVLLFAGSLYASMSRTNFVSFVVMLAILKGWGRLSRKTIILVPLFASATAAVIFVAASMSNSEEASLFGKLAYSVSELAISDYTDMADINQNWRGYESFRALITYLDGTPIEQALGQGFGSTVDLGFYMQLGQKGAAEPIRFIPTLHNGYMYILIKYGIAGILIYLYFIVGLIRTGRNDHDKTITCRVATNRLISALGWMFLFSTAVVAGLFNMFDMDSMMIVLGATMACSQYMQYEQEKGPSSLFRSV